MSQLTRRVSLHDKQVGYNIRRLRKEKGVSLDILSGATSISSKILEEYEAGTRSPSLDDLLKISQFLMLPLSRLLEGVEAGHHSGHSSPAGLPTDYDAEANAGTLTGEKLQASIDVIREQMGSKVADRIIQLIRTANEAQSPS